MERSLTPNRVLAETGPKMKLFNLVKEGSPRGRNPETTSPNGVCYFPRTDVEDPLPVPLYRPETSQA